MRTRIRPRSLRHRCLVLARMDGSKVKWRQDKDGVELRVPPKRQDPVDTIIVLGLKD